MVIERASGARTPKVTGRGTQIFLLLLPMTFFSQGAGIARLVREFSVEFDSFALGYGHLVFYPARIAVFLCSFFLIIARSYKDPYEKAMRELDPQKRLEPLVSFFVAVHNEKQLIGDCVNS